MHACSNGKHILVDGDVPFLCELSYTLSFTFCAQPGECTTQEHIKRVVLFFECCKESSFLGKFSELTESGSCGAVGLKWLFL